MSTTELTRSGIRVAALTGGTVALSAAELEQLTTAGPVLGPGDDGWADAVLVWNADAARVPALVVQPASALGVAAAVTFAREHGLLLSVKGGGHNIAGTGLAAGGFALDLSRMGTVDVDAGARLAHVGPGCRLKDVDAATQEHGLATPLGFVSEVGVAGLTLGGGLGYLTRRFGWTVDNLEEVEIVTAGGSILVASRTENAELFWAVRGAGSNVGVVTRFTFRLHEVGPVVHGGLICWPFDRAEEILRAYRSITIGAPRELAVWGLLVHAPPAPFVPVEWHGRKICAFAVCYSGPRELVDQVMRPIHALGEPIVDLLADQPYTQVQSYLDDDEPKGMHYYWRTEYVAELSDELLATARDLFADCPIPDGEVGFLHIGGALNEHREDDGAVGNRDARYVLGSNGMWSPDEPDAEAFKAWVRAAGERQRRFSTGRSYVNFQAGDEPEERVRAAYGANFDRLAAVKQRYDPGNLFRVNRNIAPAGPSGRQ